MTIRKIRNLWQILSDVLVFCKDPQSQARIIQHCNLSHGKWTEYVDMCEEQGFLKQSGIFLDTYARSRPLFKTTREGQEFIAVVNAVENLLKANNYGA